MIIIIILLFSQVVQNMKSRNFIGSWGQNGLELAVPAHWQRKFSKQNKNMSVIEQYG